MLNLQGAEASLQVQVLVLIGFRGRRARDSDTLGTYSSLVSNSIHALQITHFSLFPYTHIRSYSSYTRFFHFFSIPFLFSLTFNNYIYYYFFFNEDVEVNELEDLSAV